MSFERFFQLIDRSWIGAAVAKRRALLQYTGQPPKIYVENVRAFFGIPFSVATWLCDMAVREGYFERCTALLCPNDERVLSEVCDGDSFSPSQVSCTVCEALELTSVFEARECRKIPFYRLRKTEFAPSPSAPSTYTSAE